MFGFSKVSPEEEEDRARVLLTRRKFLFLGAAAAGAAILKPYLPAQTSYNTYLVGRNALIVGPVIPELDARGAMLATYYNKTMLETLKAKLSTTHLLKTVSLPEASDYEIKLFTPQGL